MEAPASSRCVEANGRQAVVFEKHHMKFRYSVPCENLKGARRRPFSAIEGKPMKGSAAQYPRITLHG
jgi:hypothetical protein